MPVMMFTADHKAGDDRAHRRRGEAPRGQHGNPDVSFKLATGNVGVMAATNEAVRRRSSRSWVGLRRGHPAVPDLLPIGARHALHPDPAGAGVAALLRADGDARDRPQGGTLPVVALGVGVGVDYGIYIYSRFRSLLPRRRRRCATPTSKTLEITGNGVLFTGITLAPGVATWIFSPLKFQADMGLLLASCS
jgi:uncharacterized protein